MKKKVFLIPLGIGLLIYIIYLIIWKDDTGNKFEIEVPEVEAVSNSNIKSVKLYLDNTGSMKGYVDFAGLQNSQDAKSLLIGTLSNLLDNVSSTYGIEPICESGNQQYTTSTFLKGMQDFSIFHNAGAVTELHKMIEDFSSVANDTTVTIFASDMVLSFGRKKLEDTGDPYYNMHHLEQLGDNIYHAMTGCKKRGLDVMVLQYYDDYNGNYYCNNTENIKPNAFKGKIMKDRPFYLMAIGKKDNLKHMMAKKCFIKPVNVYASFQMDDKKAAKGVEFHVNNKDNKVAWIIGNIGEPDVKGSIQTTGDFGDAISTLTISCPRFEIPGFINTSDDARFMLEWDKNAISNVADQSTDSELVYDVTLKPHKELQSNKDVWIKLLDRCHWAQDANIADDTKDKNIDKKTWGIGTVINNINKVYHEGEPTPKPQVITTFSINMIIE